MYAIRSYYDNLILVIQENKQYLSDIDGLIGDGDHGINMNKGFSLTRDELDKNPGDMVYSLMVLSRMLLMKIGGSMGPLYGKFFKGFAKVLEGKEEITQADVNEALKNIVIEIQSISPAKLGDKTLMDTLIPAVAAFDRITSYNVCYTKLLRAPIRRGWFVRFRKRCMSTSKLLMRLPPAMARITSYNVCYTKLLRPNMLGNIWLITGTIRFHPYDRRLQMLPTRCIIFTTDPTSRAIKCYTPLTIPQNTLSTIMVITKKRRHRPVQPNTTI